MKSNINAYKNKARVPAEVYQTIQKWEREGDAGNQAAYAKADRVSALMPMILTGSNKSRRRVGRIVRVTRKIK